MAENTKQLLKNVTAAIESVNTAVSNVEQLRPNFTDGYNRENISGAIDYLNWAISDLEKIAASALTKRTNEE